VLELRAAGRVRYLKVGSASEYPRVADEAARMRWARAHLPVPEVVGAGSDGETDWMLTAALPGVEATDDRFAAQPERIVPLLAEGLRRFHSAPVEACPFDFRLNAAIAHARGRVRAGLVDADEDFHPEHAHLTPKTALVELERLRPAAEDPVVCHGDYCPPNIIIAGGEVSGFVDLGELGVADRWWDLAVGSWSMTWNFGPDWEEPFLRSYGVERDDGRVAFYRLLYDLVS
jgi:kanamycin kinase